MQEKVEPKENMKQATSSQKPTKASRAKKRFTFSCARDGAGKVFLAGSFNNWNPTATPMRRSAKDGVFKTSFEPNTRRQVVDLVKWVEASVLDSGKVEIVLKED